MKNLIIRLVLIAMIFAAMPSANIAHAEGGNVVESSIINSELSAANTAAAAGVFVVSPFGKSTNAGTMASPWDLQTALNQPAAVGPGSIIWVLGGTYKGQFTSRLKGTADAYITVRAIPLTRSIIVNDGGPAFDIANSAYVNFMNLEITSLYSARTTSRSSSTFGVRVRQGDNSHHIRFINMIVHDMQAQGIGWWQALKDSEIYGSLFYYNGTTQLDHGVYAHNVSGTKLFRDNIVFDNASHGFHGYAETYEKGLFNFYLEGNTFFNNGSIGIVTTTGKYGTYKRNILVGGLIRSANTVIANNYTYYPGSTGSSLNLGYSGGSNNSLVLNNYFAGGIFKVGDSADALAMGGNVIYAPGGASGFNKANYPNNLYLSSKPGGQQVFVHPNLYELNRANITIYNWDKSPTVYIPAAQLAGVVMAPGQAYELHNVQDYFGDIVVGVYDGQGLLVSMVNHSVAQPMGLSFKPASTFPEFGTFVLIAK